MNPTTRRLTLATALLLATSLLAASPAPAADLSDLTADELCALVPQSERLTLTPDHSAPGCTAQRGSCPAQPEPWIDCVSALILLQPSSGDAAGMVPPPGQGPWVASPGIGDAAVEVCDTFAGGYCEVKFHRDRIWVSVATAPDLGLQPAHTIAIAIDQAIQGLDGSGGAAPDTGTSDDSGTTDTEVVRTADYGDVFFGNAGLSALLPDLVPHLRCPPGGGEELDGCDGAAAAFDALERLASAFGAGMPDPTQRQLDGARVYATAVQLAALEASDGTKLLPTVGNALPLIQRMPDVGTAKRLVEMLAAMDIQAFEERF